MSRRPWRSGRSPTFKRYVAPEIVGELLREGTDSLGLGGKLCDIAVLFVDIRGFTTMSEVLPPRRWCPSSTATSLSPLTAS